MALYHVPCKLLMLNQHLFTWVYPAVFKWALTWMLRYEMPYLFIFISCPYCLFQTSAQFVPLIPVTQGLKSSTHFNYLLGTCCRLSHRWCTTAQTGRQSNTSNAYCSSAPKCQDVASTQHIRQDSNAMTPNIKTVWARSCQVWLSTPLFQQTWRAL